MARFFFTLLQSCASRPDPAAGEVVTAADVCLASVRRGAFYSNFTICGGAGALTVKQTNTTKQRTKQMKMTQEELNAKIEAHALWLKTRFNNEVKGSRADLTDANLTDANLTYADLTGANLTYADLTDANLTGADLTYANLNIWRASPFVYDALAAVFSAQIALKKTRIEWLNHSK